MAEGDKMKDLFGDSEDEEEAPQQQQSGEEAQPSEEPQQSDEPQQQAEAPARIEMADLFGSDDEEEEQKAPNQGRGEGYRSEDARDGSPEMAARGPPLHLEAPLVDALPPSTLRLVKLPNILAADPLPFDSERFIQEDGQATDERGQKRLRLSDANVIRWRWAASADGELERQSNARFVRWSDGSLQLLLGDEVLDVKEIDVTGDHAFLFTRNQGVIQGQGQLATKLVFQPASLSSGFHKRLAAAMDKQHTRHQKVRATTTLVDPKRLKAEREREEEARIRERERLAGRQAKQMRKYAAPRAPRALNADYLEEDEEELEGEGLGDDFREAQRSRMLQRPGRGMDAAEEEEAARRLAQAKTAPLPPGTKRKQRVESEEDEEISGAEEEGDEEMEGFIVDDEEGAAAGRAGAAAAPTQQQQQQPTAAKRRGVVIMDSSDED